MASTAIAMPSLPDGLAALLSKIQWGETSQNLLRVFGDAATSLPRRLDFGDSYADIVLNHQTLGGVPVIVFFQMDKGTHTLKRVQVERPRHGVNPPAFRAISQALHAAYGKPDKICFVPPSPAGGYQAAAQEIWVRGGDAISAIYRDTTLEAFEGCLYGITSGPCGLTGQILVRAGPADGIPESDPCSVEHHYNQRGARSAGR